MPGLFRIFDTVVRSDFALPELPRVAAGEPSLTVTLVPGGPEQCDSRGFKRAFEWCNYDDEVVCWCERRGTEANTGDEYLFVFPLNATFHISADKLISCYLRDGSTLQMLRHLLLNQVIPRYLATSGKLVLHAGAVTLQNGKTIAFLGDSGFGKSTLVSSFHHNGAQLINDDCIMLTTSPHGITITGGLVGIRLYPDSVDAVFDDTHGFSNYNPHTDKQQLFLQDEATKSSLEPAVLDAVFLLNDPSVVTADSIAIEPVSGTEAMMTMVYSAFSLDPSDRNMKVHNFHNIGQALNKHLGLYSLKYPRSHGQLAAVRAEVTKCMG